MKSLSHASSPAVTLEKFTKPWEVVKPHTEMGRMGQGSGLGAPAPWVEVEGLAAWSFSDQPPRPPLLCSAFAVPGSGKETFHSN